MIMEDGDQRHHTFACFVYASREGSSDKLDAILPWTPFALTGAILDAWRRHNRTRPGCMVLKSSRNSIYNGIQLYKQT